MAIQQKKNQIKPALIICAVFAGIILFLYINALNVNKNVFNSLDGEILYTSDGSLRLYDCTEKTIRSDVLSDIQVSKAVFFTDDTCVALGEGVLYLITRDGDSFDSRAVDCEKKLTDFSPNPADNVIYALSSEDEDSFILTINPDTLEVNEFYDSREEILALCLGTNGLLYLSAQQDGKGTVNELKLSDKSMSQALSTEEGVFTDLEIYDGTLYMTDDAGKTTYYNTSLKKAYEAAFNSNDLKVIKAVPIYEKLFGVTFSEENKLNMYICNGTNRVAVEISDTAENRIFMDYKEKK